MNIGIFKPFKPIFFDNISNDNAAWSLEVTNLAKLFAKHGHAVHMLTETDLVEGKYPGITRGKMTDHYDRIFLICGSFQLIPDKDDIIAILRGMTNRLDFVVTDLKLLPTDKSMYSCFDKIYTQAIRPLPDFTQPQVFVATDLIPYGFEFIDTIEESIAQKNIQFYFGGTERGRLDDFLEYVWRPGHLVNTKSAFLGIDDRVGRDEFAKRMKLSKFSIVIADVEYNDKGFVTARPYEHFMHDVVCFTDSKYDIDGAIIPIDSWLRVNNFKELQLKMNEIAADKMMHAEILEWQRAQLTVDKLDGTSTYAKMQ